MFAAVTCPSLPDCGSENQLCRTQPSTDGRLTASRCISDLGSSPKPETVIMELVSRGATRSTSPSPEHSLRVSASAKQPLGSSAQGVRGSPPERQTVNSTSDTELQEPGSQPPESPGHHVLTLCTNHSPLATYAWEPQLRVA